MSELEMSANHSPEQAPPPSRRSRLRRLGCILPVVVWFAVLLLPCFMIALAVQGEIVIPQGDLPGQQIRVWLIMETRNRGIGISSTVATGDTDTNICIQTTVNYVLWQGTENETIVYCECYTRDNTASTWELTSTVTESCTQP